MYARQARRRALAACAVVLGLACSASLAGSMLFAFSPSAGVHDRPWAPSAGWVGWSGWVVFVGWYVAAHRARVRPGVAAAWAAGPLLAAAGGAVGLQLVFARAGYPGTAAAVWAAAAAVTAGCAWRALSWLATPVGDLPAPLPGQVWWADVKFAESNASKDRPVVVLSVSGRHARVLTCTSVDKSRQRGYLEVPAQVFGPGARRSFLRVTPAVSVPLAAFRRVQGPLPGSFWDVARAQAGR